jgi:hypothetical protein
VVEGLAIVEVSDDAVVDVLVIGVCVYGWGRSHFVGEEAEFEVHLVELVWGDHYFAFGWFLCLTGLSFGLSGRLIIFQIMGFLSCV